MAKVVLFHPLVHKDAAKTYAGSLGLSFVYSFLKKQGHELLYIDSNLDSDIGTVYERIKAFNPGYFGITVFDEALQKRIPRFMKSLKNDFPDIVIVLGGPSATEKPREVLEKTGADFAVQGDGIPTIQHIIDGELDNPGIARFEGDEFVSTGLAPYNPDEWHADADTFEKARYTYPALSTVGCPKPCNYCTHRKIFPKVIKRELEDVIVDMSTVASKVKDGKFFLFNDDNFLVYPDRLVEIDDAIAAAGLPQKLAFQASADYVLRAEEQLRKTAKRIDAVTIGVESFVDAQLKRYGKGTTAEQNHQALELLRELGITRHIFSIVGDKHTDMDELCEVATVFAEHPEYLFMLTGSFVYADHNKEDPYEGVPEFVHMFNHFFQNIDGGNYSDFLFHAEKRAMKGDPIPEQRMKDIEILLQAVLIITNNFKKEKMSQDEALKNMNRYSNKMLIMLSHLYCTNHDLDIADETETQSEP